MSPSVRDLWPESVLFKRRPEQRRRPFDPDRWQVRHHVVPSKANGKLPKHRRAYFDCLPAVQWKGGEFSDIVAPQPRVHDVHEHHENVRRRFLQFPEVADEIAKRRAVTPPASPAVITPPAGERAASAGGRRRRYVEVPYSAPASVAGSSSFAEALQAEGGDEEPRATWLSLPTAKTAPDQLRPDSPSPSTKDQLRPDSASPSATSLLEMGPTASMGPTAWMAQTASMGPIASMAQTASIGPTGSMAQTASMGPAASMAQTASMEPTGSMRPTSSGRHVSMAPTVSMGPAGSMAPTSSTMSMTQSEKQAWSQAKKQLTIQAESGPYQTFVEWAVTNHTHLVSLWRRLDTDMDMTLRRGEFMQGLKNLRYPYPLEELFTAMDRDHTGTISFLEFAPEHALDFARFKHWAEETFGSVKATFVAMDRDHNGKVTYDEFYRACMADGLPARLHDSVRKLFLLCDDPEDKLTRGSLSMAEVAFLDRWKFPVYLREQPDLSARMQFQNALLGKFGRNPLLVWRVVLDRDSSMRVNFQEFVAACKLLTRAGLKEADPRCGVPALYCAIDQDRSGWFTLRDWDHHSYKLLEKLVRRGRQLHGKVSEWVRKAEESPGAGIEFHTFRANMRDLDMTAEDKVVLFDGLSVGEAKRGNIFNVKPGKRLRAQDVFFLERWNLEEEEQADNTWSRKAFSRMGSWFQPPSQPGDSDREEESGEPSEEVNLATEESTESYP